MPGRTILEQIEALDPEKDHQRIVFLSTCYEFPFDTTRALELALFRTFCVPSISALLDRTGEFRNRALRSFLVECHVRKRCDQNRITASDFSCAAVLIRTRDRGRRKPPPTEMVR